MTNNCGIDWYNTWKIFDLALRDVAIAIGAVTAIFYISKKRPYKAKLSPKLSCDVKALDNTTRIIINAEITNVGEYSVPIPKEGFLVTLSDGNFSKDNPGTALQWEEECSAIAMFVGQNRIETGETVNDCSIIEVPNGLYKNVRFKLYVEYAGHDSIGSLTDYGTEWYAHAIVSLD